MDVATVCIGIRACALAILAAEFGSLCDSQCMMMWGIVKGCHIANRFIRHSVCFFHEHHCLDADRNTGTRIFVEMGEEGSQLVHVGKWLVGDFLNTPEKIVEFDCI